MKLPRLPAIGLGVLIGAAAALRSLRRRRRRTSEEAPEKYLVEDPEVSPEVESLGLTPGREHDLT